ncbi:uncharacterized LOC105266645 [Fopius arisanus]|uniref:RPC53 protein n=1 Tax=Fopius arisanus TaxID=64838 RepID=A0A0C9RD83_9HYME|nr:uncharacterized LOC105266645 [Fopius arisanus]KAG8362536.1 EcKinase 5 [Fopius arisanus]
MALASLAPDDVFFQEILRRGLQDPTIQDAVLLEKKPAVKKGENYLSELTRFTVKYSSQGSRVHPGGKGFYLDHLIMKEEPSACEKTLELLRKSNIFNIERAMLEEVVPKMEELLGRRLGPKVYYSSMEPQVIVMEDLVARGFNNKNRKVGFNEQQMSLVLENLADFHAASVLLDEQDREFVSRFKNGLINENTTDTLFNLISKGLEAIAEGVCTWTGSEFSLIAGKLRKRSQGVRQELQKIYHCDGDELKVLNHGDVWVNNIMIRDDDNGESTEARLIDYQISIWTSPAIDLLYFLSIAPERNIKMSHDDIFLQTYLTRLKISMKKLGCSRDPPTLTQLKKSMHKRRAFALLAALIFWPKMLAEDDDVEGIDDLLQNGESRVNPLKYPHAQEVMEKILPILNERGYLD